MAVIRLGLIGCGYICKTHLKALKELNDLSIAVTALVDINKEAAESTKQLLPAPQNCQVYGSVEEAGDDSYDAAVIMVPHHLHVEIAREVLSKGKHVLLEKPLAISIEGCRELLALAQSTDRVFMVAESAVHWPEVVQAIKLIKEGVIGEPYYAQGNCFESIGIDDFDFCEVPDWIYDPEKNGGGAVMAGGVHWIRPLRLMLGDMDKVAAMTMDAWKTMRAETLAHALVKFKNGKQGVLHFHYSDIPMEKIPFFQIFGPKGEITIHGKFEGGITVHTKDKVTTDNCGGYWGSFKPQMASFISALKKEEKITEAHTGSVSEAVKDVLVSLAIYRSVEKGGWENVDV
uniref:Gfo/Idh/MocA-like oxidoreductase N-terminal domain-containing protein n=1 Tax=Amphimedon queenslandica TaxID=400682 RepID=A0A1X7VJS5_AMPQE